MSLIGPDEKIASKIGYGSEQTTTTLERTLRQLVAPHIQGQPSQNSRDRANTAFAVGMVMHQCASSDLLLLRGSNITTPQQLL